MVVPALLEEMAEEAVIVEAEVIEGVEVEQDPKLGLEVSIRHKYCTFLL